MKSKKWLLIIMSLFVLSGCSQPDETSVSPTPTGIQYMAEDLFTTADEKETVTLPGENTENQNAVNATTAKEESELPEYLKPQGNIEYVKYDAANRHRDIDLKTDLDSKFCLDPDTGVAYFVNQNKDWYIYRLIDGKAELAVEIPARELYILNGTLYFILEDYDKYEFDALTEGDIYAYTLADGKVEKIYSPEGLENEIHRMRVYEDGIAFDCQVKEYLTENTWNLHYYYYYYTFADSTLKTDPYRRAFPGWENYYLEVAKNETGWHCELWNRENYEKGKMDLETGSRGFVVEDTFYTFTARKLWMHNLRTKEQKFFDITVMFKELVPKHAVDSIAAGEVTADYTVWMEDITVTKDYIWTIIFDAYVFRLDPVSGEAECYWLEGENHRVINLYTDGINLYATYGGLFENSGALVRICTEKIIGQHSRLEIPILAVEHLTD